MFGVLEFGLAFLALPIAWKFGFVLKSESCGKGSKYGDSVKLLWFIKNQQ